MAFPILGLHHVTATVNEAQPDLDFCIGSLGLRLVKKTVNFDNHQVYHFYYGDERGTPGTIWTTFPYAGRNVRIGTKGAGQVTTTSFSVPRPALDYWRERLRTRGLQMSEPQAVLGEVLTTITDPSGLSIALVATDRDTRAPWAGGSVPGDCAVRGIHSVTMTVRDPEPTIEFMTDLLGYSIIERSAARVRMGVNGGGPGKQIDLLVDRAAPAAVNGIGTVHHVAMAIADEADQTALRDELLARDVHVTPVMDRQYFRSIYFREPGGVLFEVATIRPGFELDEPLAQLGAALKLPAWAEENRGEIERGLARIRIPS